MRVELQIPGDLYGQLGPNERLHWRTRHARQQDWKGRTILAWRRAGCPQYRGKVRIQITFRRGRVVDPDNLGGCITPILNGLKSEAGRDGCIRDDSARYVELLPIQQVSSAKFRQRPDVLVQIELCSGVLDFEE